MKFFDERRRRIFSPSNLRHMENYKWIASQPLETLITPFPHSNMQELLDALEARAKAMVDASPAISLLMSKGKIKKRKKDRENQADARFQIYCKYRAWGYFSPQEMMESEPDLVAIMNGEDNDDDNVDENYLTEQETISRNVALEKALKYARAIIDLQHQLVKEKGSKFVTNNIDALNRKALHLLVESNNKTCHELDLPKLKTATINRNYGKGSVEITQI